MSIRVNYIVANYIGPLRTYPQYRKLFNIDPLYFCKKHLDFLETIDTANQVIATFVFNDDIDEVIKAEIIGAVSDKVELIFRKNSGFSYGIWNDTIIQNLNNYDYFFLIEDDYLPTRNDFLNPFLKRLQHNTAFVCGLVELASANRFPGHVTPGEKPFLFPSISNGLISASACKKVYNSTGSVFKINLNKDYWSAYTNQIYFCKPFIDMDYTIVDTMDEYSSYYNNATVKDLVIYGADKQAPLLIPIEIPYV